MLTLGSLFDGIGGWLLAAQHAGVKPLWRCEIDKFPRAVSEYHFPDAKSYGDIRGVRGNEIAPVDIICAGSPCQNLSLAGNRKGLQGNESSLFYDAIRILREMRDATNGKYPRFFVWENVTGAFSSNHGNDFRAVLSEIGQTEIPMPESGRWGGCGMVRVPLCDIAWRTLDAQYWGVPQRRRRIFLVADFAAENRCTAEVLFVEQSVPRDFEKSGTTREEVAAVAGDCAQAPSWCIAGNIINRQDKNGGHHDKDKEVPLYDISHLSDGVREIPMGASNTLLAHMGTGGGNVAVLNEAYRQKTDDVRTVRRLTVTECERLQGLPDGYTDVPINGKPARASERLKAIGNGMAQPCADFVLKQIVKFQRIR